MKRVAMFVLVCACLLVPLEARANDGGWWDWLWKWDPKFYGFGSEIHLLCLDQSGNRLRGCEQWFKNVGRLIIGKRNEIQHLVSADVIKHQIDFRFGYYRNYDARYDAPDPPSDGTINALKLMVMYNYHVTPHVALIGGMGYLPVWGDRFPHNPESRGIMSAGLLFHVPKVEWLTVRPELGWIPGGFTGADFGDPGVSYAKENIVNFSIGIGFDLRRYVP